MALAIWYIILALAWLIAGRVILFKGFLAKLEPDRCVGVNLRSTAGSGVHATALWAGATQVLDDSKETSGTHLGDGIAGGVGGCGVLVASAERLQCGTRTIPSRRSYSFS